MRDIVINHRTLFIINSKDGKETYGSRDAEGNFNRSRKLYLTMRDAVSAFRKVTAVASTLLVAADTAKFKFAGC